MNKRVGLSFFGMLNVDVLDVSWGTVFSAPGERIVSPSCVGVFPRPFHLRESMSRSPLCVRARVSSIVVVRSVGFVIFSIVSDPAAVGVTCPCCVVHVVLNRSFRLFFPPY